MDTIVRHAQFRSRIVLASGWLLGVLVGISIHYAGRMDGQMTRIMFGWTMILVFVLLGVSWLVNSEKWSQRAMSNLQDIGRLVGLSVVGPPSRNRVMVWSIRLWGLLW